MSDLLDDHNVFCRLFEEQDFYEKFVSALNKVSEFGGYPRLNEKTVNLLDKIIGKHSLVLELGCGGSTLWFAERASVVVSIEDNPIWFLAVKINLQRRSLSNSLLLFRPGYPFGFFNEFLSKFDFILVDGSDYTGWRVATMKNCVKNLKEGGIVLVDDAERESYREGLVFLEENLGQGHSVFEKDIWGNEKLSVFFQKKPQIGSVFNTNPDIATLGLDRISFAEKPAN